MYIKNQYITYHDRTPYPLRDVADNHLVDILDVKRVGVIRNIQPEAIDEIIRRYSEHPFNEQPLRAGCSLALFGKTHFKQRDLQQRLKALGIEWHKEIVPDTTHVLVGWKIDTLRTLQKKILLSERELQQFLDEAEQPYLRDNNQNEGALDHLKQLLLSPKEDNQKLAVELIKGGGFSEELITPAFVASKIASSKSFRAFLKQTLDRYLSPVAREHANKNYRLAGVPEHKIDQNIKKYTKYLSTAPGEIRLDGLAIAQCLYQSQKTGIQYLWKNLQDQEAIEALLRSFVVDGVLDLSDKGISQLPEAIGQLSEIHTLDLSNNIELAHLPKNIVQLEQLESLDLTFTFINDVHVLKPMSQLKKLRLIQPIRYIEGLDTLTQLQELHLRILIQEHSTKEQRAALQALEENLVHTKIIWHQY